MILVCFWVFVWFVIMEYRERVCASMGMGSLWCNVCLRLRLLLTRCYTYVLLITYSLEDNQKNHYVCHSMW